MYMHTKKNLFNIIFNLGLLFFFFDSLIIFIGFLKMYFKKYNNLF